MAAAMRTCAVPAGTFVIRQGETGDAFYVVVEGSLEALIGSEPQPVRTFGPGDSFGELALLYSQPRNASIRCAPGRGARLFKLGRIHFRNLVSRAMRESRELLERQLASVPELAGLGGEEYTQLAEAVSLISFEPGARIIEVGGSEASADARADAGGATPSTVSLRDARSGKPIAALSFTATNYAKLALRSDQPDFKWANNDAGTRWLTDFFFNARIAHECKGRAKGARLHSFGACREAFYVAEEKARLREGAAKLRADEDREDSSTGSEDAS